jgi:hypothetical protein
LSDFQPVRLSDIGKKIKINFLSVKRWSKIKVINKMIRKITRILSIAFILFISLFALDVFGEGFSFIALIMNLIPTFVAVILTVIAWKKEFLGGILWLILGIFFLIMSPLALVIYVPTIIIGGLNLWSGKKN